MKAKNDLRKREALDKRVIIYIDPDKNGYLVNIFSSFSMKTCCGYSLEAFPQGASNEYPQHMFSWRNKKNINTFELKKSSLSEL